MGSSSSLLGRSGACSPGEFFKNEHRKTHFPGIFIEICAACHNKITFSQSSPRTSVRF